MSGSAVAPSWAESSSPTNSVWSPVAYSASLIHSPLGRVVYALNPMAGVIQGFRWALIGAPAPGLLIWPSVVVAAVLLVSGLFFFKRMEDTFADVI